MAAIIVCGLLLPTYFANPRHASHHAVRVEVKHGDALVERRCHLSGGIADHKINLDSGLAETIRQVHEDAFDSADFQSRNQ